MYQSKLPSFLLSLCLHAGVVAAVLFWPAGQNPPVDLAAPVINVDIYTLGRPGKPVAEAPKAPTAPAKPESAPEAPPAKPETPPPPQDPTPKPVEPAKPEAQPIPIPPPDKPVEPPKPDPKPAEPPKKPEPPKRPSRPRGDPLAQALRDLGGTPSKPGSIDQALRDLKPSGGDTEGDGPGGQGGDGIGIVGSYMQSLVSRIKRNYEYVGRADRKNPTAIVEISIAKDGTIINAEIVESSGDDVFNGFVLSAVRNTQKVEPPPTPDLARVRVPFAYRDMK